MLTRAQPMGRTMRTRELDGDEAISRSVRNSGTNTCRLGCGRTGIEAVGGKLMLATPSCGIFTSTRAVASASLFVTPSPAFVEDMACDAKTFGRTLNKTALWVVHPYDTEAVAYEAAPKGSRRPACK